LFLAKYVQKAHSDSAIKKELKNNEGLLFIDIITPSDIAFVISVIKNNWEVWDQKIRATKFGAALPPGEREVKLRPLFTEGSGEKRSRVRLCGVMTV
jgi:hypothetical protein